MKNFACACLLMLLLLPGCYYLSSQPEVSINSGFEKKDVAVLDFSVKGVHIAQAQGVYTSDKLSDKLFLSKACTIIDRSRVREAESFIGITPSTPLSADQILKLGLRLKAKYLVLGEVTHIMQGDAYDFDATGIVQISMRILSVMNGDVVGVATYQMDDSDAGIETTINNTLDKMVPKIVEDEN